MNTITLDLEVKLALSAFPPRLRPEATVYLFDPAEGYNPERKGSYDFTCLAEPTHWVRVDFRKDSSFL